MEKEFSYTEKAIFVRDYELDGKLFQEGDVVDVDVDLYYQLIQDEVVMPYKASKKKNDIYREYYFVSIIISIAIIILLSLISFYLLDILVIVISLAIMFGFNIIYSIFKMKEWYGY